MHPLDNPVWHALAGPQHTLAETVGNAARYPTEMVPFAAVADLSPRSWEDLATLVGPAGVAVLFGEPLSAPEGWETLQRWPTVQMVLAEPRGLVGPSEQTETLGAGDTEEMLELVARTDPGPFAHRTIELGTYLGIRREGRLVAMAGERMHLEHYREISAVCTDPGVRGEGLARVLVSELIRRISDRGETAFLHALASNRPALALYEDMGFELRRHNEVIALIPPGTPQPSPPR